MPLVQLPDDVLVELGRVTVASAKLENAVLDLLYEFTDEDFTQAVQLLGTPGVSNAVDDAKRLVKVSTIADESKGAILERLRDVKQVTEQRNDLLHAEWTAADVQRRGRHREARRLFEVTAENIRNLAERLDNAASSVRWSWEEAVAQLGRLDPTTETTMPERWPAARARPATPEQLVAPRRETHVNFFSSGQLGTSSAIVAPDPEDDYTA